MIESQNERRRERRHTVNLPATIRAALESSKIECCVRDVSASGAQIAVEGAEVPDDFVLCLSADGTVSRICKVVWRKGSAIGVKFAVGRKKEATVAPVPKCSPADAASGNQAAHPRR